jgi:GLPGLI family protein
MKNSILLLLVFLNLGVFSQSSFQGEAVYRSKTTMDMNFGRRPLSEDQKKRIADRMRPMLEKTSVLRFNQIESLYKEEEKLGAPGQGRGGRFGGMMSSFTAGPKYKNTKEGVVLEETEFFGKKFLISEEVGRPDWKLEAETKKIGNYTCYKATYLKKENALSFSSFARRGRAANQPDSPEKDTLQMVLVTAWYAPQIPVSQGPGEFWGLPGLILEVKSGTTTLLCTEIRMNPTEKIVIKKPTKGKQVTRQEYTKIVTKKMSELRSQFRGRGRRNGRG